MSWAAAGVRWRVGGAALLAGLLAGCTVPPQPGQDEAPPSLKPLTRELAVPPGAQPRSAVPSVRYDLFSPDKENELPSDDGLPGDGPPTTVFQRGGASWYGIGFHMRKTANGERFDMGSMTAAHRTLAFNTVVCVRSLVNGREVLVRINDRGPYASGRIIDLSRAAAEALDMVSTGIKQVSLHVIDEPGMRCNGTVADVAALQPTVGTVPARATQSPSKATPQRPVPARLRR